MALEEEEVSETARLFGEFLAAAEDGRDVLEDLLARAGPLRSALEARILLHKKLSEFALNLDSGQDQLLRSRKLGRFEIIGALGRGGSSRVFVARDPKLGRKIALKILDREALLEKSERAWILNEARALARLEHPGVVKIYEVGETQANTFIAMELLSGRSLEDLIQAWCRGRAGENPGDVLEETRALALRYEPYSARLSLLARIAEALA